MKVLSICATILLLLPGGAASQNIIATTATCTNATIDAGTAGCVIINVAGQGSLGFQITGTWTGTVTFSTSLGQNGADATFVTTLVTPVGSATQVSTATANGVWSLPVAGFNQFKIAITATGTGTAVVNRRTTSQARSGGGGGGSGGTVTSVGLSLPGGITVTNSPVTTTGTLTGTLFSGDTQVIYNDGGAFGGVADFTFSKMDSSLAVSNTDGPAEFILQGTAMATQYFLTLTPGDNDSLATIVASGSQGLTVFAQEGLLELVSGSSTIKMRVVEDLIWDLSSVANTVGVSSSTGVTSIDFSPSIDLKARSLFFDPTLNNTKLGYNALAVVTSGIQNVAIGEGALNDMTTGQLNTAIGYHALENAAGADGNVAIGRGTLTQTGSYASNTVVGNSAGSQMTGSYNTAIGSEALTSDTAGSGSFNIGVGLRAGNLITTGSHNIAIGDTATVASATGNDQIAIGSTSNSGAGYFILGSITTGMRFGANIISGGSAPSVANVGANSCGTTAASVTGNSNSGRVTVGATSGTQCRITTTITAPTGWRCAASNTDTANLVRCIGVDTTHFDLVGVFVAADDLDYVALPN